MGGTVKGDDARRSRSSHIVTIQGCLKMGGGETVGQRIFAVRLALGDGVRKPMSLRAFVAHVADATGRTIHASELSGIETGKRGEVMLNDLVAIAAVDPLQRGVGWLVEGGLPSGPVPLSEPTPNAGDGGVTTDEADAPPPPPVRRAGGGDRKR